MVATFVKSCRERRATWNLLTMPSQVTGGGEGGVPVGGSGHPLVLGGGLRASGKLVLNVVMYVLTACSQTFD